MTDWRVWILGGALGLALALSAVNIWLHQSNLSLQVQVNERQQRINEGVRLSQFNTQFVQALATMAAGTGDQAIASLLEKTNCKDIVYSAPHQEKLDAIAALRPVKSALLFAGYEAGPVSELDVGLDLDFETNAACNILHSSGSTGIVWSLQPLRSRKTSRP